MLFNSYSFVFLFLPPVLAGFFWLGRRSPRAAAAWLVAASLAFYAGWNPLFVLLLVASALANFGAGRVLARAANAPAARWILAAAVAANLALLGFFKYANFFIDTWSRLGGGERSLLEIVLPVGISFFTFTQVAFLVDVRRGFAREYDLVHYLLFVSYFPHLVAGPIIHHAAVMPQFQSPATYRLDAGNLARGLTLFTLGLAKKVLLADAFADYSDAVFDAARDDDRPMLIAAWGGALAYTLQLYFDFSAYSDMAVGLSLLFNVKLPFNFDSPYKARSIVDFWRRWHMTLSRFLRDYVYVPLGGNRRGPGRRYLNVLVTMLLGGLWHGASWTFVAWGGLHGVFLVVNQMWRARRARRGAPPAAGRLAAALSVALTFALVVVAWVIFRSPDFATARIMLEGMAGLNGVSLPKTLQPWLGALADGGGIRFEGGFGGVPALAERGLGGLGAMLAGGLAIVWMLPNSQQVVGLVPGARPAWTWRPTRAVAIAMGIVLGVSILHFARVSPFLYYQF